MIRSSKLAGRVALFTLALVACGDDGTSGTGGSSTTGTGAAGGVNTGAGGTGAGGEGANGVGASGGVGGTSNGGAGGSAHGGGHAGGAGGAGGSGGSAHGGGHAGGAGGAGGSGGSGHGGGHAGGAGVGGNMGGGGGEGGAGGGGEVAIHGCTTAIADNQTGSSTVDLTWTNPLVAPSKCVRVAAGTLVRWNGDFGFHPLEGGISPTSEAASIITLASPSGGTTSVNFTSPGVYPFFCGIHTQSMQGVIYVE